MWRVSLLLFFCCGTTMAKNLLAPYAKQGYIEGEMKICMYKIDIAHRVSNLIERYYSYGNNNYWVMNMIAGHCLTRDQRPEASYQTMRDFNAGKRDYQRYQCKPTPQYCTSSGKPPNQKEHCVFGPSVGGFDKRMKVWTNPGGIEARGSSQAYMIYSTITYGNCSGTDGATDLKQSVWKISKDGSSVTVPLKIDLRDGGASTEPLLSDRFGSWDSRTYRSWSVKREGDWLTVEDNPPRDSCNDHYPCREVCSQSYDPKAPCMNINYKFKLMIKPKN